MSRLRPALPGILQRPRQGWSSLLLLLGLLGLLGASVAAARPLAVADSEPSRSLVVLMMAAGLIGFLLARSSIGVVKAHLLGAAAGASMLLLIAGAAVDDGRDLIVGWAELQPRLQELRQEVGTSLDEYVLAFQAGDAASSSTPAIVTFLVLGAILWTTAQFSAFSVFRYDRGGPAVTAIGVVLFLNIGLGTQSVLVEPLPTLPQLALFAGLAMLLLVRLQLTQQGYQWARRHIADTGEVGRLFLRTGVVFVAFSVVSASALTVAASMDEQEFPDIGGLEDVLDDLGQQIAQVLPILGARVPAEDGGPLGDSFEVPPAWTPGDGTAFRARLRGAPDGAYWWMTAHDRFDGFTWDSSEGTPLEVPAGERIMMTPARFGPSASIQARIQVEDLIGPLTVVKPTDVVAVDKDVVARSLGRGSVDIGSVDFPEGTDLTEPYAIESAVVDYSRLTASELRTAGTRTPPWMGSRYTRVQDSATGPRTQGLAAEIAASADNAYDRAIAVQEVLQDMRYSTDLEAEGGCGGLNIPECTLELEAGFCQYYASTMVMVLREMDVPSRLVRGYLPGEPLGDEEWIVDNAAFHAWVEVYFPSYGWVRFDPTPGNVQGAYGLEQTALREGGDGERPPPGPTFGPEDTFAPVIPTLEPTPEPTDGGAVAVSGCELDGSCSDDDAVAAFIIGGAIAGLLLVATFGLLFYRFRRLAEPDGGLAYRGIVSLATRLGFGPHPSQTEYEYAGSLSEVIPTVRDDLYLVAHTRVETAYGQRQPDDGRRAMLRRAYARIRTALLRLSFRRGG